MAPQQPGVIKPDLSTWGLHPTMDPESASSPGVGGEKVLTKKHLQSGWSNSYLYRFFNLVYDRPHTPALNKQLLFWGGGGRRHRKLKIHLILPAKLATVTNCGENMCKFFPYPYLCTILQPKSQDLCFDALAAHKGFWLLLQSPKNRPTIKWGNAMVPGCMPFWAQDQGFGRTCFEKLQSPQQKGQSYYFFSNQESNHPSIHPCHDEILGWVLVGFAWLVVGQLDNWVVSGGWGFAALEG